MARSRETSLENSKCQSSEMTDSTVDPFSKSGPRRVKKGRTRDEAGRLSMDQIMYKLTNFVKEFVVYAEDNRESLKKFKQGTA